jgi:hydroxypyruvate reductase
LSDVVGDDPSYIASGPCAPDPDTFADALALLHRYGITPPLAVSEHLLRGQRSEVADTPKPGSAVFAHTENRIVGSARASLSAAQSWLEQQGFSVINLGEIEGESSVVAVTHAEMIRSSKAGRPLALLSGGETTVTVGNEHGRGGRNTEYLLALGLALRDVAGVWAIACDTAGIDGTEDNAGAVWTPDSLSRADAAGLDAASMLAANDAHGFFAALGDLVVTVPTRTNVNDFRLLILV